MGADSAQSTDQEESAFWKAPDWLRKKPRADVFETIYRENIWGASGGGSKLDTTVEYRRLLVALLRKNHIRSVLDIGCGDWEFSRAIPWDDIHYVGIDIVSQLIEENRRKYGTHNIQFLRMDAVDENWPVAELLIVKDVLQHLSNAGVSRMLKKVQNYRYALITNNYAKANFESEDGDTRPLNLRAPPFNLSAKRVMKYDAKEVLLFQRKRFPWTRPRMQISPALDER